VSGEERSDPGRKALLVAVGFGVTLAVAALFLSFAPSRPDEVAPTPTQTASIPSPLPTTPAEATDPPAVEAPEQTPMTTTTPAPDPDAALPTPAPAPTATPPQLAPDPTPSAPASDAAPPAVVRALVWEFDTRAYATRFLAHARSTAEPGVVLLMERTPEGGWGVWIEGTDESRVTAQLEGLRTELGFGEPPTTRQQDQEIE